MIVVSVGALCAGSVSKIGVGSWLPQGGDQGERRVEDCICAIVAVAARRELFEKRFGFGLVRGSEKKDRQADRTDKTGHPTCIAYVGRVRARECHVWVNETTRSK